MSAQITAITNQKGGVGKTTSTVNLGVGLAREGKKVLLVDGDPQGSLTISMGIQDPDSLTETLSTLMLAEMEDKPIPPDYGIIHHQEGVDQQCDRASRVLHYAYRYHLCMVYRQRNKRKQQDLRR